MHVRLEGRVAVVIRPGAVVHGRRDRRTFEARILAVAIGPLIEARGLSRLGFCVVVVGCRGVHRALRAVAATRAVLFLVICRVKARSRVGRRRRRSRRTLRSVAMAIGAVRTPRSRTIVRKVSSARIGFACAAVLAVACLRALRGIRRTFGGWI